MSFAVSVELLLDAYRTGIFPMGSHQGGLKWYSPDPRCIIDLPRFHLSKRLARTYRQWDRQWIGSRRFTIEIDKDFDAVIRNCATRGQLSRSRQLITKTNSGATIVGADNAETWISQDIIEIYKALFEQNYVHTVEAYIDDELVGGLYGVAVGGAFMGESMFHTATDASKICLVYLVEHLQKRNFVLLDCQYMTGHLRTFGAIEIAKVEYMTRLRQALALNCLFNQ